MKLKFIFGIALLVIISFIGSSCRYFSEAEKKEIKKNGEIVIAKIEAFKKEKGRLPENEAEMGVKVDEGGPIFYKKKNDSSYQIWGVYAAEYSYIYDSETKEWKGAF